MARDVTKTKLRLEPHQVILRPMVTEKGYHKAERCNAYTFEVNRLAGKDDIRRAVEELFDVASALLRQPLPRGNRVGILTGGGGFGCVTSDACGRLGLDVAPLQQKTIERLSEVLPDRWPHANPVDTVATGQFVTYPCIWPLLEDENLDALMIIGMVGQMHMMSRNMAAMLQQADDAPSAIERAQQMFEARQEEELRGIDKLIEYMDRYQKPVLLTGRSNEAMRDSPIAAKLRENGMVMYPTPERAAKVLAHLVSYGKFVRGG